MGYIDFRLSLVCEDDENFIYNWRSLGYEENIFTNLTSLRQHADGHMLLVKSPLYNRLGFLSIAVDDYVLYKLQQQHSGYEGDYFKKLTLEFYLQGLNSIPELMSGSYMSVTIESCKKDITLNERSDRNNRVERSNFLLRNYVHFSFGFEAKIVIEGCPSYQVDGHRKRLLPFPVMEDRRVFHSLF